MTAASPDEAVQRLGTQGLTVTEIAARGDEASAAAPMGDGVPADVAPDFASAARPSLRDRLRHERATQKARPLRVLLVAAVFVMVALTIGYVVPVTVCECERLADGTVECSLGDRALGVYTLREQKVIGVASVETEAESWTETSRHTRDGRTWSTSEQRSRSRIVLHDRLGNTARPAGWYRGGNLGTPTDAMKDAVEGLLAGTTPARIWMWQGDWISVYAPGVCLLLAILMLALMALSMSRGPTDWVYRRVEGLAEVADDLQKAPPKK